MEELRDNALSALFRIQPRCWVWGGELGALGSAVSQRRSGRRSSPAPVRTRASVCVCARAPGRAKSQCPVMVGDLRSAQTLRVLGLNQYSTAVSVDETWD